MSGADVTGTHTESGPTDISVCGYVLSPALDGYVLRVMREASAVREGKRRLSSWYQPGVCARLMKSREARNSMSVMIRKCRSLSVTGGSRACYGEAESGRAARRTLE